MQMKTCSKKISDECFQTAPAENFVPEQLTCKNCKKEINRRFYQNNRAKLNLKERARVKSVQRYIPSDFQNAVIYKLVNEIDDKIYVGSTCNLDKRFTAHKSYGKTAKAAQKVYRHFKTIGWDTVKKVLLEKFPCSDEAELTKRERYWVDKLNPELNTARPSRTEDERKESIRQGIQRYHQTEKYKEFVKKRQQSEKSKQYRKEYYLKKKSLNESKYTNHYVEWRLMKALVELYRTVPPIDIQTFSL
jgi:group I intron endonuclease